MSFQDYQCFGNETEYQQWHPENLGHWEVLGEWCTEEYDGLVQRLGNLTVWAPIPGLPLASYLNSPSQFLHQ